MNTASVPPPPRRLLLTGAAGALGSMLRPRLRVHCEVLRVSDLGGLGEAAPGEEVQAAPLQDRAAMAALLQGVDAVVHLGGVSVEKPWELVRPANIDGLFNLYEGARLAGTRRVVFASSNHAIGAYPQSERLDDRVPTRPDGYYGLSKVFGEQTAQLYWDRYGIETVSLRIGSCFPVPRDHRMLTTWLSYDDLERLVLASLRAPQVGHTIVYGVSNNSRRWWDDAPARRIGYQPLDSADDHTAAVQAAQPVPGPDEAVARYQGGAFMEMGPFEPMESPPAPNNNERGAA